MCSLIVRHGVHADLPLTFLVMSVGPCSIYALAGARALHDFYNVIGVRVHRTWPHASYWPDRQNSLPNKKMSYIVLANPYHGCDLQFQLLQGQRQPFP